jgi:hypothetical protein
MVYANIPAVKYGSFSSNHKVSDVIMKLEESDIVVDTFEWKKKILRWLFVLVESNQIVICSNKMLFFPKNDFAFIVLYNNN